jgi:uncharacterized membrane-anchored protein YitT (DUF2179 family)
MKSIFSSKYFKIIKNYIILTVGSFITGISINIFLVPNKIAPGGVSGLATVLYYLLEIKVGVLMLLLNIPLFLFGIKYLGGSFGIKTLYSTIMLSVFVDHPIFITKITSDILLASVFGGVVMGVGLGIVFYAGATTGGTDLAAKIARSFFPHISVGKLLLFFDAIVILFAAIVFKNYDIALYAVITLYLSAKVIDVILEGVDFAKAVLIISSKPHEISQKIIHELERGVTTLKGLGGYSGNDKEILLCIMRKNEIPKIKELVKNIDIDAFIVLYDVREVLGEGFREKIP